MDNDDIKKIREAYAQRDAELLVKLVGKNIVRLAGEWDEDRRTFRKFYDIRAISSVELETEPQRAVILRFTRGNPIMIFNMAQFDNYICKIDEYGSIREYLEANEFSAFARKW